GETSGGGGEGSGDTVGTVLMGRDRRQKRGKACGNRGLLCIQGSLTNCSGGLCLPFVLSSFRSHSQVTCYLPKGREPLAPPPKQAGDKTPHESNVCVGFLTPPHHAKVACRCASVVGAKPQLLVYFPADRYTYHFRSTCYTMYSSTSHTVGDVRYHTPRTDFSKLDYSTTTRTQSRNHTFSESSRRGSFT
ncbi:unnamed protein product, partial [Ectocarpus sp. 8 AP-2014]